MVVGLWSLIVSDTRAKASWCYESESRGAIARVLLTDGTPAMILYRLMQSSGRHGLAPLEMLFNRLNSICCNCIIGRGAEFGPRFVLVHATGVVIDGRVRGGADVKIEHQVTIGAERRESRARRRRVRRSRRQDRGSGARRHGRAGRRKRGRGEGRSANATVVGIPARVVRVRDAAEAAEAKVVVGSGVDR